jgi:hypothetical protein
MTSIAGSQCRRCSLRGQVSLRHVPLRLPPSSMAQPGHHMGRCARRRCGMASFRGGPAQRAGPGHVPTRGRPGADEGGPMLARTRASWLGTIPSIGRLPRIHLRARLADGTHACRRAYGDVYSMARARDSGRYECVSSEAEVGSHQSRYQILVKYWGGHPS